MCMCMFVYACLFMHVVHVHVCLCMLCMFVYACLFMHVCLCMFVHVVHVHVCLCMFVHVVHVHVYTCLHAMTCLHAGRSSIGPPPPTSPPVVLLVRSLSLLLLVVWYFGRSLSVASRFRAFSWFLFFFCTLCMPITPDEANFKQWLESQSCVQYWVYDPLSQEPKLLPGWSSAQAC